MQALRPLSASRCSAKYAGLSRQHPLPARRSGTVARAAPPMDDTEARQRSEIAEKAAIRALESLSDESMCIDELSGRGGTTSVAIIGAGSVGASIADQLLTGGVATEVLLADVNTEQCEGQVLDLSDCAYVTNSFIRMGSNKEAGQCDIVIITAGAKQRPGESRLDLIGRNTKIIESVCNSMRPFGKDTVLMLVANPVDVLTSIAQKVSGLPPYRVVGSGTYLDSMRLRGEIAKVLGVSSSSVHAYVLGEHGDSQVATWSSANVGGIGLLAFPEFQDPARREEIAEFAKNKAYAIIERKGATYYGVAACVRRLCEAILRNQKAVMPISVYNDDYGLYMSQPAVLGAQGVLKVLPLTFSDEELRQFEGSAAAMKAVLEPLGFWNGPFPKLS